MTSIYAADPERVITAATAAVEAGHNPGSQEHYDAVCDTTAE